MIFGSVCSGMEGASEAWKHLGWKLKFVAEIEAAPAKVIAHHPPTACRGILRRAENRGKEVEVKG